MTHIHSFDINLAKKYSIEEALLITHFQFWIRINRTRNKNIIEGRCWTYQTIQQIKDHFPYWSYETVKYFIEKLIEKNLFAFAVINQRKQLEKALEDKFYKKEKIELIIDCLIQQGCLFSEQNLVLFSEV